MKALIDYIMNGSIEELVICVLATAIILKVCYDIIIPNKQD